MWAATDSFHFVWKKVEGDVSLSADLAFLGQGGDPHRKGVLMVRQSFDTDSAYADAALHGDGLTSLQARDEKGARTYEVQSNVKSPARLRIEKRGDYFYMSVARVGEPLRFSGGSMRVPMKAAAGTSTFLVGMTAVATAALFYADGKIDATVVVPAMIGIFVGGQLGSTLTSRMKTANLVMIFVVIMAYLSISMILKSFGITLPGQE